MTFDNKDLYRSGAARDSENLKTVFEQMNYHVEECTDFTKLDTLKKFNDITKRNDIDSLVLFFLSHGKGVNDFQTKDGSSLNVTDIMYHFSNTNCPGLRGKPKILLFNFNRVDFKQSNLEYDSVPKRDLELPKDMTIVHASLPNFMAYRSTITGTLFVSSLCKVLCDFAQTKDLNDIVVETSQLMQSENGSTASYTSIDMMKKFYFM